MNVAGLFATAVLLATGAAADPLADTMRAWCTQTGTWTGEIAITDAAGKQQSVQLVSRHRCTPDERHHIVEEDFIAAGRSDHTVKVTYIDPGANGFRTAYFAKGPPTDYAFAYTSIEWRGASDWRQSIQSPPEGEMYEGRKAILRYTRERKGDRLISRKEVRFLDGEGDFVTRSLIEQRRTK